MAYLLFPLVSQIAGAMMVSLNSYQISLVSDLLSWQEKVNLSAMLVDFFISITSFTAESFLDEK